MQRPKVSIEKQINQQYNRLKAGDDRLNRRNANLERMVRDRVDFLPAYADTRDRQGNIIRSRYLGHRAFTAQQIRAVREQVVA